MRDGFDAKLAYQSYDGMPIITRTIQSLLVGRMVRLIRAMREKGAPEDEVRRAIRHYLVLKDAEKHKLNYKQSAADHGIAELMAKYGQRSFMVG